MVVVRRWMVNVPWCRGGQEVWTVEERDRALVVPSPNWSHARSELCLGSAFPKEPPPRLLSLLQSAR